MKLLLGTKNQGKIHEILSLLSDIAYLELLTFHECPFEDVTESGKTFRENALLKVRGIYKETGLAVLAEDSGLEVEALKGVPGVHSARFAGERATDHENVRELLRQLKDVHDRKARFVCVAVLHFPDKEALISEGELLGHIARKPRGSHGFGYDPVFIPKGFARTLGELGPTVKDQISHRRRAIEILKKHLRTTLG